MTVESFFIFLRFYKEGTKDRARSFFFLFSVPLLLPRKRVNQIRLRLLVAPTNPSFVRRLRRSSQSPSITHCAIHPISGQQQQQPTQPTAQRYTHARATQLAFTHNGALSKDGKDWRGNLRGRLQGKRPSDWRSDCPQADPVRCFCWFCWFCFSMFCLWSYYACAQNNNCFMFSL